MKPVVFILSIIISNSLIAQTIEWNDPDKLLILNYETPEGKTHKKILYAQNDSIKMLNALEIFVDDNIKNSKTVTLDVFLKNMDEIQPPCILRDGEVYLDVFTTTRVPEEGESVITIKVLFENASETSTWELPQTDKFRYPEYTYKDYELRER